jgi:hypothetical protein
MPTFRDLFIEHVGPSLERQLALEDTIGPCEWHLDMPEGTISFDTPGRPLVVPMQVLGSEADASATWIAAFAIDPKRMPPALADASRRLRAIGEREHVPELANGRVPLDEVDGEKYSLVASALLRAAGHYRAPFSGGAMFILLPDPSLVAKPTQPSARIARILEVFPRVTELLSAAEQKRAFAAYVKHHGGKLREEAEDAGRLHVEWDGESLGARVDADGTVYGLETG